MRYTLLFATAIFLATSSCRMMNVPETRNNSGPYVQLKNGKKYEGSSAERSTGLFVKDKIVLGDTSFKSKDVAFYSTGGMTYANVGRKTFAPQVATGKINLYKYEYSTYGQTSHDFGSGPSYSNPSMPGGGSSTTYGYSKHISYYIQKNEGAPIQALTYNHLKPMVSTKTPEYNMLEKYRKTRTISRILGYGSLGLFTSGVILANSNSSASSNLGVSLAAVGVGAFIGWAAVLIPNKMRLLKTVLIADKADKSHAHHHRVN